MNKHANVEHVPATGLLMLLVGFILLAVSVGGFWLAGSSADPALGVIVGIVASIAAVLVLIGIYVVPPNMGRVLQLFGGEYRGTVTKPGLFWSNPFYTKARISMRAITLNGDKLKVNDRTGNPIEIAAVIVWQVVDCCKARFDVDDYASYVRLQSETALRHIAGEYGYDAEEGQTSLMHNSEEVLARLRSEIQARVDLAGITVLEARLSHLAYAPEIAAVMLRKQQASAIIAARQRIVDGAVGMVEMAIEQFGKSDLTQLDDERKAAMVSNLMVVLCSESNATPVVNAGSVY